MLLLSILDYLTDGLFIRLFPIYMPTTRLEAFRFKNAVLEFEQIRTKYRGWVLTIDPPDKPITN